MLACRAGRYWLLARGRRSSPGGPLPGLLPCLTLVTVFPQSGQRKREPGRSYFLCDLASEVTQARLSHFLSIRSKSAAGSRGGDLGSTCEREEKHPEHMRGVSPH